jgi:GNAT superfamily N-acetyltransferase
MPRFGDPEPLAAHYTLEGFDSGDTSMSRWLLEHARQSSGSGSARTYVVVDAEQERVVGYHALAAAAISPAEATRRARRGQPQRPIPEVLIARLAVDVEAQGRGVGAFLLRDAMTRALSVSEQIGARVLLVHALHAAARTFYERWGFEQSPTDPLNLQLLFKDVRKTLG